MIHNYRYYIISVYIKDVKSLGKHREISAVYSKTAVKANRVDK